MDKLDGKAMKVFKREYFPKFLATVDADGSPNVVPVLTMRAADETTLIFARFMVWKTARNLEATRKATIACIGPSLYIWTVKADFVEFIKQGPYLEEFNETALFRYNAYAGVNEVGVLRVKEVLPPKPVRWLKTLMAQRSVAGVATRAAAQDRVGPMPLQVVRQFRKKGALKYIAHVGADGYPIPRPALAMFPVMRKTLALDDIAGEAMDPGTRVAASAITKDLIAYQVKGRYEGLKNFNGASLGAIDVEEVFTASPPLPGKRIER